MFEFRAIAVAGGAIEVMNRLTDRAGNLITQADVDTITYTVYGVGPNGTLEAVTGHDGETLTVADVVFDELQTGAPWSADATGYNFLHALDVSANAAFVAWGARYLIVYRVNLTSGQPIVWPWKVRTPNAE